MRSRPARSAARSTATDGAVLPGVTVEARSDVLPQPRVTVTGANGEYRLPALPPGTYTLDVRAVRHADRDAQGAGAARAGRRSSTSRSASQASARRSRSPPSPRSSTRTRATITSGARSEQISALPVGAGLPRPAEAHPRRAVHAGPDRAARAPAAAARTTSTVRRRQRDAAAVRHALGRARVARHRPGHRDQGRRAGGRLRPRRRLLDRLGQQVGHQPVPRRGSASSSRPRAWPSDLDERHPVALRAGPDWIDGNLGGPILQDRLFFYGSYYRPDAVDATTRPTSTASCRTTTARATRASASSPSRRRSSCCSTPATATRSAWTRATCSPRTPRATTGTGDEARLKIGTVDGSWVINTQSFAHVQVHRLREPDAGPPGQHRRRRPLDGRRHAARHRQPRHAGPADRARAGRRADAAYNAFVAAAHRPLRLRPERRARWAAASSASAPQFNDDDFFRDAGQVGYNLTLGTARHPRPARRLPAVHRCGGPACAARTAGA